MKDCRTLVSRFTLLGCTVVDPFCGVGSIPLAAKLEGRKFVGIERSRMFAALARKRLAEASATAHVAVQAGAESGLRSDTA